MINKCLTFYGTNGPGPATLEIDRTAPIDLTPFFQEAFDKYYEAIAWKLDRIETGAAYSEQGPRDELAREYKKKYTIDPKKAVFPFKVEEFFSTFLNKYAPDELAGFLQDNIADPDEFGNEAIIKRLKTFNQIYSRVFFEYDSGPWFRVIPIDKNITHIDIEKMIHPSKIVYDNPERNKRHEEFDAKCDEELLHPETSTRTKTRRYNCTLENKVEEVIRQNVPSKEIIRVFDNYWLPPLNHFNIIVAYKLPTEHLDIISKI